MTLPNIDTGTLLLLAIGAVFLCVVVLLIFFGLQVVGTSLTTLLSTVALLINGGPAIWCGCLVLIFACAACIGGVILVTTCNADPTSMNFCTLIP
jgi:hypothetical protein